MIFPVGSRVGPLSFSARKLDPDPDVGGIKTALFGGEGLFFATLRGPGRIWLQSLPFSRLAGRIIAAAPGFGKGGREEGSLQGGLGRRLDGDNS